MSLHEIDSHLFYFINRNLQNNFFDVLMPIITDKYYLLLFILALWLIMKDKKHALISILLTLISVAFSDLISNTLKHLIERPRPCHVLDGVRLLIGCGGSFSMPSNHAANSFAMIGALSYKSPKWVKWLVLSIAVTVGFSRIYVGVHYLSDVVVGALVGIVVSFAVICIYEWAASRFNAKPYSTILLISLFVVSLFRICYIAQGIVDLSPDEAHYWEWSRRLDLSYYSKGPMIAYFIAFGTAIFGNNIFGIRIMAVVFSTLSSVLMYLLGRGLYDERTGTASAIIMQIVPLYSAFGVIFTIDSPFIFFWILSLLLFWRAVNSEYRIKSSEVNNQQSTPPQPPLSKGGIRGGVWLLLGLSMGLGLLTKYTMAFFYICAFLFLLSSKQNRNLLLTRWPYISLILSLIVFSPVIIWNLGHDLVTLRHTAGQAHISEQWSLVSSKWSRDFFEFFGSQIGIITPVVFVLMIYSLFRVTPPQPPLLGESPEATLAKGEQGGVKEGKGGLPMIYNGNFLFWFSIPIILFFLLKSLHGKVQANWALPGYITGIIAFSALFIGRWESIKKWLRWVVIAGIILSFSVTAISHYTSILKLPPKKDPSSRIKGWKELGKEINRLSDELSEKGPFFIFSDRYQVSSELAFYVKGKPVTYCINLGRRMNQYDLWPGFDNLITFNAIFVTIDDVQMPEAFKTGFDKCEKKTFTVYNNDSKLRDYSIFICYGFKGIKHKGATSY